MLVRESLVPFKAYEYLIGVHRGFAVGIADFNLEGF